METRNAPVRNVSQQCLMRLHGQRFRFWRWLGDFWLAFRAKWGEAHRHQTLAGAPDPVPAAVVGAGSAAFLAVLNIVGHCYFENAAILNSALFA